ncbi:MAG: FAD-binding oxidoreductase [Dehalococcoidia bacterium]|jgi:glycine oxidase|nr:FAD-binding oxidoreductase [Dehalococcoidia bacterium]|tara:strand:+ start:2975 stop:4075 length:1101 start_codon:yes stop_codon:yes gene_type:complete
MKINIVGGGIVGTLSAFLLSKSGHEVFIFDPDSPGSHASGFAFGEMSALEGSGIPDPLLGFTLSSFHAHKSLIPAIEEISGIPTNYQSNDKLNLAFTSEQANKLQSEIKWQKNIEGFEVSWVTGKDLLDIEPLVNPECIGATLIKDQSSVEPYKLTLSAATAAEKLGTTIITRGITDLLFSGDECSGVKTESSEHLADVTLLTMGPWSQKASEWIGYDVPVRPLKGQILRLDAPGININTSVFHQSNYVGLKPDGLIWAGTTEEEVGFDENTTNEARDQIMMDLLTMIPSLDESRLVHHTACLRPLCIDSMPIVDKVSGFSNLFIATGAGRKGILWSAAMSHGIVDMILGNVASIQGLEHLKLDRF